MPLIQPFIRKLVGSDRFEFLEIDLEPLQCERPQMFSHTFQSELHDKLNRIRIPLFEQSMQRVASNASQQSIRQVRFEHGELGVKTRFDRLGSKQTRAKRVNRADPSPVDSPQNSQPMIDTFCRAVL